jgi:uncharacterized coiled-coil protein SlyX
MTSPVQDQSLSDAIAELLPVDLRERFYRRMAHLRNLTPDDELLQIVEAMGFLALLIRETPAQISIERVKLENLFHEVGSAVKIAHESTLAYNEQLDRRLEQIPISIALALNPQNTVNLLSEMIRQQFQETGIPTVSETLAAQSQILRRTVNELSDLLEAFCNPEQGALSRVHAALTSMQGDFDNAANHVRALTHTLAKDLHHSLAVICAAGIVLGFSLGVFYVQWIRR